MAPLTRRRCGNMGIPDELNALHYAQRASAGLIIAEATNVSAYKGYSDTPGLFTNEQIEGWKKVTEAVHQREGKIFVQLWHTGRYAHPDLLPEGYHTVAPSSLIFDGEINTPSGYQKLPLPKQLSLIEIKKTVDDFAQASLNAKLAGFDGIEIHAANGYLIDQFLSDGTNIRTDNYGGSVENRFRFLQEILLKCIQIWGENRVGVRLSPSGIKNGMSDSNPAVHFAEFISYLNQFPLAYLHLIEPLLSVDHLTHYPAKVSEYFRRFYKGTLIANGGFQPQDSNKIISELKADLLAFGKYFISNPDLPERIFNNLPLTPYDLNTFYGGDKKGYTDYQFYNNTKQ